MKDVTCDFNCPNIPRLGVFSAFCCVACPTRRQHITTANRHLWTDDKGFLGPQGCKLPRDQMPEQCRYYDCKSDTFYACTYFYTFTAWDGTQWVRREVLSDTLVGLLKPGTMSKLTDKIKQRLEKYNEDHGIPHSDGSSVPSKNERDPAPAAGHGQGDS